MFRGAEECCACSGAKSVRTWQCERVWFGWCMGLVEKKGLLQKRKMHVERERREKVER